MRLVAAGAPRRESAEPRPRLAAADLKQRIVSDIVGRCAAVGCGGDAATEPDERGRVRRWLGFVGRRRGTGATLQGYYAEAERVQRKEPPHSVQAPCKAFAPSFLGGPGTSPDWVFCCRPVFTSRNESC